jgi:hypothetical protein
MRRLTRAEGSWLQVTERTGVVHSARIFGGER